MSSPIDYVEEMENTYTAETLSQTQAIADDAGNELAARLNEQLKAAQAKLADVTKENRALAGAFGRANESLATHYQGNWTEHILLLGSVVTGLALGYWLQGAIDKRIPWISLVGVGCVAGGALIKTRWSVRGALIAGGTALAGGAAFFVFSIPDDDDAEPEEGAAA